jgi:hypothetical protein
MTKGPGGNPVHPAIEVPRHVGDRFPLSERFPAAVYEDRLPAQCLHRHFKGDTSAKTGLLKQQRQDPPCQGVPMQARGPVHPLRQSEHSFGAGPVQVSVQHQVGTDSPWTGSPGPRQCIIIHSTEYLHIQAHLSTVFLETRRKGSLSP